MAGGKETPRQKMVGMMYLVLTALLALNVSKAILDAFISIEENIQRSNESEYFRGDAKRMELQGVASSGENAEKAVRAKNMLMMIDQIDSAAALRINEIDALKLEILKASGEEITKIGSDQILLEKKNPRTPLIPWKMNLNKVNGQDKYDESMRIMFGDNIKTPQGKGLVMWENYHQFKTFLCNKVANYESIDGDNSYHFKTPDIREFKDQKGLNAKFQSEVLKGNVNPSDREVLFKIYSSMSKNERYTVNDVTGVHWLGKTFDHSPVVASIASLSSLQKEILAARADAVSHLFERVGGGEYSFNKIIALAYGPELVAKGETINVEVLMAAYDTDIQPSVTMNGATVPDVAFGKGKISIPASRGGDLNLNGTISITNKHGVKKLLPWSKNVKVIQPMGTISIPAYNILYKGYNNVLQASVSGYDQSELRGENVVITQNGNSWIAKPMSASRDCSISIYGKSSLTNRTVNLGSVKYRVSRLPKPDLQLGGSKDGDKLPPSTKKIIVKFPIEVPLDAPFEILEWSVEFVNTGVLPIKGTGDELSPAALSLFRQLPAGKIVEIRAKVLNVAREIVVVKSSFIK
ncbi:MAG: hypothetical protein KJ941_06905 [Bacteroidetes bacterium]|nr:hypothetical protein [Bacteroidota bacterium]